MSKPSKHPAPKSKKPTPKQEGATKEQAVKDAAPATTPTSKAMPAAAKPRDPRLPAPGATIPREYKGKVLKVKYLEDGVEVDGKKFDTLSAAARHVTGAASINGFLFFNLIPTKPARKAKPATATKSAKGKKSAEPKIGNGNDLGTLAGQRAALAAAGIARAGRPISKPRGDASAKDGAK